MRTSILFCTLLILASCGFDIEEPCVTTMFYYEPVYEDLDVLRTVSFGDPETIQQPGKIYVYGSYLLINEVNKGIHVIDNSDQTNPHQIGFYHIMGNNDLAVKNDILFADNYLDILSIDISDIENPTIIGIEEEVYDYPYFVDAENQQFVVDFVIGDAIEYECNEFEDLTFTTFNSSTGLANLSSAGASSSPNMVGQAGSMARFAITNDYLYVVDDYQLHSVNIENASNTELTATNQLPWGVETIFPYKNNLFIGARTGMHIFSIDDPANPLFASTYTHFEACDPVVVQDEVAFVTIRDGNFCGNRGDQLLKLDVSDIYNPTLITSMGMRNPHGLGVKGDHLFICEAELGIQVYNKDVLDNYTTSKIFQVQNVNAKDIILLPNNTAIVMTDTHFKQYDISNIFQITELSNFIL